MFVIELKKVTFYIIFKIFFKKKINNSQSYFEI